MVQTYNGIPYKFQEECSKSELIMNGSWDSELNEKSQSQNNYVKYNSICIFKKDKFVSASKRLVTYPPGVEQKTRREQETDFWLHSTLFF